MIFEAFEYRVCELRSFELYQDFHPLFFTIF